MGFSRVAGAKEFKFWDTSVLVGLQPTPFFLK